MKWFDVAHHKRFTILLGLAVLFLTPVVLADVPKLINFQGILRDGSGNPVPDAVYTVRFRVYDDSTAGSTLWEETVPVPTASGLFNVRLGDATALPHNLFSAGVTRFVGVKVNLDPEMTPRTRVISVPFAFHALRSDSAATATVALDLTCIGCVGTSDIDAAQVQRRVTGTAPPNEYITAINQDGSVTTAVDQAGAASGWTDDGAVVRLSTGTDNVGIGTTSTLFGARLEVVDRVNVIGAGSGHVFIAKDGDEYLSLIYDAGFARGQITTFNSSQPLILQQLGGSVGIGTTSPAQKLDVAGTTQMTGFKLTTSPAAGRVLTADATGVGTWQALPSNWNLTGNAGTNPSTNFFGTTDNQALVLKVNNARVLRLEPNTSAPNIIGGHSDNSVTAGAFAATVGGGGFSGFGNTVTDDYGTVGGGIANRAGDGAGTTSDHFAATVGGGSENTAGWGGSTVGGGIQNNAGAQYTTVAGGIFDTASAIYATVGGGYGNVAGGSSATVSGGELNRTSADAATVGGGSSNLASGNNATVAGGLSNQASGFWSAISGGSGNTTIGGGAYAAIIGGQSDTATGSWSAVLGGLGNKTLDNYSIAAGRRAKALHSGAFVWGDGTDADFASTAANQFLIRAGNVGIGLNNPTKKLEVAGSIKVGTNDTVFSSNISSNSPLSLQAPAGTARMHIDDVTGSVGIGTTSPTTRLQVAGGQLSVDAGTDAAPGYSFAGDLNTGIYGFSDFLFFATGGTRRGYFTNNGLVVEGRAQIGTTTAFGDPSTLYVQGSIATDVTTVVGATTLTSSRSVVLVNTGATTITLPLAALAPGRQYTIKKISAAAGIVSVDGNGAETIDGAATHSLTIQYEYVTIVSNGTSWFVVADN